MADRVRALDSSAVSKHADSVLSCDISKLRYVIERNTKQHQHETALYWADKVLTLSGLEEDALVCANCLFVTGQHHRAIALVKNRTNYKEKAESILLIANCHAACKEYEQAVTVISDFLQPPEQEAKTCTGNMPAKQKSIEASSLHLLLGKCYEAMGNYELASDAFRQALLCDVYCFEALSRVTGHQLLTSDQEESLLADLPLDMQCEATEEKHLLHFLYSIQLNKYATPGAVSIPNDLSVLQDNMDVVVNMAERFYYNCYFREAYKITTKVLEKDPYNLSCLPLHIALQVELRKPHELFSLAHKLVDIYPHKVVSWYGVACYYHLIQNNDLARQYFCKATSIDPMFGPAWLAFGHSFAAESEHDQAMAAYFKASQLMKGCHLPFLYIGLEYGLTSTSKLADKFFSQALKMAPNDPFVLHEMGVIAYQNERYVEAEKMMLQALEKTEGLDARHMAQKWEPLINNLAHTCRKLKKYAEALAYHERALLLFPRNAATYSAIGYVFMLMLDFQKAVDYFHKSLSLRKNDAFTTTMLNLAVEETLAEYESSLHASTTVMSSEVFKGKLNMSLLHDTTAEELEEFQSHTSQSPEVPDEGQTNLSVDMEMSMDDL